MLPLVFHLNIKLPCNNCTYEQYWHIHNIPGCWAHLEIHMSMNFPGWALTFSPFIDVFLKISKSMVASHKRVVATLLLNFYRVVISSKIKLFKPYRVYKTSPIRIWNFSIILKTSKTRHCCSVMEEKPDIAITVIWPHTIMKEKSSYRL